MASLLEAAWAPLSAGHKFLIITALAYCAIFHVAMTRYPTLKQRSWVLTALGSAFLSLASLPFVVNFAFVRGDVSRLVQIKWFSDAACRMFQAYLVSDLFIGSIYYRSRITLMMGWIHHVVYFILVHFLISWNWTHIFLLAGIMELPTFLLSIASMHPTLRNDILFASTFFATRIVFHVILFTLYLVPSNRHAAVDGSFWPAGLFALAFPMHVIWFSGSVKGFIKRAKERAAAAKASADTGANVVQVVVQKEQVVPDTTPSSSEKSPLLLGSADVQEYNARLVIAPPSSTHRGGGVKAYPPSTYTLQTTYTPPASIRRRPLREIQPSSAFFPSPSSSSFSSSSSPSPTPSRLAASAPSILGPGISPIIRPALPRRRSLISYEREEALRRLAHSIAEAFPPARAPGIAVKKAVAMGRGVRDVYYNYRGYYGATERVVAAY